MKSFYEHWMMVEGWHSMTSRPGEAEFDLNMTHDWSVDNASGLFTNLFRRKLKAFYTYLKTAERDLVGRRFSAPSWAPTPSSEEEQLSSNLGRAWAARLSAVRNLVRHRGAMDQDPTHWAWGVADTLEMCATAVFNLWNKVANPDATAASGANAGATSRSIESIAQGAIRWLEDLASMPLGDEYAEREADIFENVKKSAARMADFIRTAVEIGAVGNLKNLPGVGDNWMYGQAVNNRIRKTWKDGKLE